MIVRLLICLFDAFVSDFGLWLFSYVSWYLRWFISLFVVVFKCASSLFVYCCLFGVCFDLW